MKTLVVFYSRTGTTKKVAEDLAQRLGADTEELIDTKSRAGVIGWITAGRDAMKNISTTLEKTKYSPSYYDLVIIGTPVWAGNFSPAVRAYLEAEKSNIKDVAFFVTQGAIPPKQDILFGKMEELCAKKSRANLHLSTKQVKSSDFVTEMEEFLKGIGL